MCPVATLPAISGLISHLILSIGCIQETLSFLLEEESKGNLGSPYLMPKCSLIISDLLLFVTVLSL